MLGARSVGWKYNQGRRYYQASSRNATLDVPFDCKANGCGVLVFLSRSYQPLGLLSLSVDGVPVVAAVSAADPAWAAKKSPEYTVMSVFRAVSPRDDAMYTRGLKRGRHVLTATCLGTTLSAVRSLHLKSFYEPHQVHVRGLAVVYDHINFIDTWNGSSKAWLRP